MERRKSIIIRIGIIMLIALILGSIGFSWYIGIKVFEGSTQLNTKKDTTGVKYNVLERYNIDYDVFINTYQIELLEVTSTFDGHVIPGDYIYAENITNKDNDTVILVHGLGGNRYSNYPLAEYFLSNGYNIITFDQRSTGENTAQYTTFGYWESKDVIDLVNYVNQNTYQKSLGIWGTSFGGATIGIALENKLVNEDVDFAIMDCPISSMSYMIRKELENMDMGIPVGYMQICGDIVNSYKLGFSYADADVCNAIKNTKVPVLVINSKADSITPYFMGKDIYDAIKQNNKDIMTVDDSKHAEIWIKYNKLYRHTLDNFINKYSEN